MNYRSILKNQLQRRQELSPRYSLRSFAKRLKISPSKLSEVINGKKKLSVDRALAIAQNLGLANKEKEIFILTVQMEGQKGKDRSEIQDRIAIIVQEINAQKTEQRNAWYFGATKALLQKGMSSQEVQKALGITSLQVENAERFIKRIKKFHPEREEITFEPSSLIKKIQDEAVNDALSLEGDFLFLSEDQVEELQLKIRSLIKSYKVKNEKNEMDLKLFFWGNLEI